MKTYGKVNVNFHSFLTLTLDEDKRYLHPLALSPLYLLDRMLCGSHSHALAKLKISVVSGKDTLVFKLVHLVIAVL